MHNGIRVIELTTLIPAFMAVFIIFPNVKTKAAFQVPTHLKCPFKELQKPGVSSPRYMRKQLRHQFNHVMHCKYTNGP